MKVRYYAAVSADGYIAAPDGSVAWLEALDPADPEHRFNYTAFFAGIEGLVMGRGTYDAIDGFDVDWPYEDRPTVVLTTRTALERPPPPSVQLLDGGPDDALAALRAGGVTGDVWLVGGGVAAAAFLDAGRLDTVELTITPVLLGAGIRALAPRASHAPLRLIAHEALGAGMVHVVYEVVR